MLFHVTLVHDGAHCPGYHPEMMPAVMQDFERREEIASRHGVKVRMILNAAPDHVIYVIAEAERPLQLAVCVGELLPFEQAEIRMSAVETAEDAIEFMRSMGPPPGR